MAIKKIIILVFLGITYEQNLVVKKHQLWPEAWTLKVASKQAILNAEVFININLYILNTPKIIPPAFIRNSKQYKCWWVYHYQFVLKI